MISPWTDQGVSASSTFVTLRVHPGATSEMNCGWHSTCLGDLPPAGHALDWKNVGNANVTWVSFALRSSGSGAIGNGTTSDNSGTCYSIRVAVVDAFGFQKGSIYYVHSTINVPHPFSIPSSSSGYGFQHNRIVGKTAATDLYDCSYDPPGPPGPHWGGPHLHQNADSSNWQKNTWYYCTPVTGNDCGGTIYPNYLTGGYQQYLQTWWW